jgi:hexokinase
MYIDENNKFFYIKGLKNIMREFLRKNYLSDDFYVLDELSVSFLNEMKSGLEDQDSSSLLMLPSYAMVDSKIALEKKIVVIDAGGTNLRIGLVWFDKNGNYNISGFKSQAMFGTQVELNKDEFFQSMAHLAAPYLDETDLICISFAYPTIITKDMDGQIIKLVKELKVTGVDGCLIGKEMSKKLEDMGKKARVMVTNDTTATAFAGIAETINHDFDAHIGVIIGTGMNTCYPEKYNKIAKLGEHECDRRMMINVESGNFDKLLRSEADMVFDASTIDPNYHVLEKMVSGGYLGGMCQSYIKSACDYKLFTAKSCENLMLLSVASKDVSMFLDADENSVIRKALDDKQDLKNMKILLKKIVRRAANLAALQIYSLSLQCAYPGNKVCITIEGTTYYKVPRMQKQTIEFLNQYMSAVDIKFETMNVEDAVMKGCAAIGLQA